MTTRPPQDTPDDLVARLLGLVRGQFCGDFSDKQWFQNSAFIRRNVILWPARFVTGKGFTIPAARYEEIMRSIFSTIIRNGQTAAVKYWPGYLMHCVQEHWRHHWEEYYQEAKSVRALTEAYALRCRPGSTSDDKTVETLSQVHKLLATKPRRQAKAAPRQLALFVS